MTINAVSVKHDLEAVCGCTSAAVKAVELIEELTAELAGLKQQLLLVAEDIELGQTAIRFMDRAGDVHPGIDDVETICVEFYTAMAAVVNKYHPTPSYWKS